MRHEPEATGGIPETALSALVADAPVLIAIVVALVIAVRVPASPPAARTEALMGDFGPPGSARITTPRWA